jgi:glycosyltransferase involved in cell wall biosynthesis
MRITIVQGAFFPIPPLLGGAVEKEWFALGKEFASRGHKVVHVSRAYENLPREEVIDGVSYKRVAGFNAVNNLTLLKLLDFLYTLRVLKELPEADILVSNTFWLPLLACNPKFGKIYVHVSRYPRGQLKLYHCASRLQAPSVAIAREIVRQEPWSKDKVCVIPYFAKERANLEAKRLSGAEKYILYVGRIHPEKGLDLLIEAFKLIIESGIKGCRLVIVGPWEIKLGGGGEGYFMQLQKQAASIRQFIDWIGPIFSEEELTRYYLGTS